MKYSVQGVGDINLTGSDFMATGGEAKIYKKNKLIYKIYHDSNDMIADGKIHELQNIKDSKVLIPKDIILDKKGVRVGFTMDFIDGVTPLCQLFTNTFINQNNVSNDTIVDLVKQMQETINTIHSAKCIQVDGNEMNYLVDETEFNTCYFIDVNSYQTQSFPATVIMPSIRDWTAKSFNELTDWFSFAIIMCQLFIGTHPYKGKHPDFKRHDIENRMKAHVSIFNPNVTYPKSVRDFSRIPSNYMDWFLQLFEEGKRIAPPSTVGKVDAKVKYIIITSTDNFDIEEIDSFNDTIIYHSNLNNIPVTRTKSAIHLGSEKYYVTRGVYLVNTPILLTPVLVKIENGMLEVKSIKKYMEVTLGSEMRADELFIVNNTIYVRLGGTLVETKFIETDGKTLLISKNIWTISENSSQLFRCVIVQDLLGSKHVSIPEPRLDVSKFTTVRCEELDKYSILDAKYENYVTVFSVFNPEDNEYGLIVSIDLDRSNNHIRYIRTDDFNAVNFTVLDSGITILIYDDQMEVFSNNPLSSSKVKIIKDKELTSDMNLCRRGVSTRFFTDNKLYSIRMRK